MNFSDFNIWNRYGTQWCNSTGENCSYYFNDNNTIAFEQIKGIKATDSAATNYFEYVLLGLIGSPVGIFGLIGNVLCLFVLRRPSMKKKPINILLLALTICDIIVICGILFLYCIFMFFRDSKNSYAVYWKPTLQLFLYPLLQMSHVGSIVFTVLTTIERYGAICKPIKNRTLASTRRTLHLVGILIICIIVYSSPFFFLTKRVISQITFDEETNTKSIYYKNEFTELMKNNIFQFVYISPFSVTTNYVIPLIIFLYCNFKICSVMKETNKRRQELTITHVQNYSATKSVTCIIGMSTILCLTELVKIIFMYLPKTKLVEFLISQGKVVSFFVGLVNSSVNFLFYCLFGSKFRRELVKMSSISIGS